MLAVVAVLLTMVQAVLLVLVAEDVVITAVLLGAVEVVHPDQLTLAVEVELVVVTDITDMMEVLE
jgi:hypothetical protein